MKKPLEDYLTEFYDSTSTISELLRTLNLGGIGIVWLFKNSVISSMIPKELICPLVLIVLSLCFDLLQYLWKAITIYIFYKSKEKLYDLKKLSEKDIADVLAPAKIEIGAWIFFTLKIILTFIAYMLIFIFILNKL